MMVKKHFVEYLVHTVMCICSGFIFSHYSIIADAHTIMTPRNDIPIQHYEQWASQFCYFLCPSCTFYPIQ